MENNGSSSKFGCIIVLLIMILLAILVLIYFLWQAGHIQIDLNSIINIPTRNNSSNETLGIGQDNISRDPEYREYTFLPFDFVFEVPAVKR